MKHLNSKVSVAGIFFAVTALLVFYLLSERWIIYLPVALFWVAVALMLGTVTYQILKIELSPSYVIVLLLEVAVTCFVFHLIYQLPTYGLVGSDSYGDLASAKSILSSGFVLGGPPNLYDNLYSYFPTLHVFGATLSLITGIDILSVAKWFPSLLGVALIPLVYLLVRSIFKGEKVALLSALLFACLQDQILWGTLFVRETIALVLAVCCLYLYFSAKHFPHPASNYALSIMCLVGTVFAHHLTSFLLLVFLSIHFLVTKASEVPFLRRAYFGKTITGEKVTITFLLIGLVTLFAYWMFVVIYPVIALVTFIMSVFTPTKFGVNTYANLAGISATSIQTIGGYITYYGFYFFNTIFGFILLYQLLPRAKKPRVETYSFTLFFFLCGLLGLLSLYLVAPTAYPNRFLTYGWLFGFAPLVVAILKGKRKWLKRASVLLLIAFMLFNIYLIGPSYYTASAAGSPAGPSEESYALANAFDFSRGTIFGSENPLLAIYDVQSNLGTVLVSFSNYSLATFTWIIIQKQDLESAKSAVAPATGTIAALEHLDSECPVGYNKIYDSNNLEVFAHAKR